MQAYVRSCDPVEISPSNKSQQIIIESKVYFEQVDQKKIFVATDLVQKSKKMVIFSHGFHGNCLGPARQFVTFAKILNQAGFSTVRFDQPCCGNSQGDYLGVSFADWVQTTIYFAKEYLSKGYQVTLMGQSMGASTSVIAAADSQLRDKIANLLLWVPDPKSDLDVIAEEIYEEDGEKYRGEFWLEARDSDFFGSLKKFKNPIHLVYGEDDRYIDSDLRL